MLNSRRPCGLHRFNFTLLLTFLLGLPASLFAQGPTGIVSPLLYPGANLCLQIQAAIAANAGANPQGLVIDARSATGTQQCTVNPFAGAIVPGQLLLGATVLQTTAPIVTPSVQAWQILGTGRGNNLNETGTLIQAVAGFPVNGKVVRLGDGTALTFGNRIENVAIDCNGIAGTIGLYSTDIQEESGGSNLAITSCPARELWINGSGSDGAGPQFAMNYDFHDVEGLALNSGTSTTVACEFDGYNPTQPNGPHVLEGLTCSGSPSHPISAAFVFDSFSSSSISNLNAESASTGYVLGNLAPLIGVSFDSLVGGSISGVVVHVKNTPVPPNHAVTSDVALSNIVNAATTAPLIQDDILGKVLTERVVGTYRIGVAEPSFGSFIPGYTHISDSPFSPSQLPGLVLNNATDTPTANILALSAGLTTTGPSLIEFDDRSIPRWLVGKDSTANFEIFDSAANVLRMQSVPNANTEINAASSGTLYLNLFSGTGGVAFCNGAGSACQASINSSGTGSFASVAIPGLGASTHPLCTTAGGVITNVGCSAPGPLAEAASAPRAIPTTGTGQTGTTPSNAGSISVEQVEGAAPLNSPSFAGTPSTPGLAGIGNASFALGAPEAVGGPEATVSCAVGHICDSYSGTALLITGSSKMSSEISSIITVSLPITRGALPNCLVNASADEGSKPLAAAIKYLGTSSIAVTVNSALSSSTAYSITYLCGGN